MTPLTQSAAWISLAKHADIIRHSNIQNIKTSSTRSSSFIAAIPEIQIDFSNQRATADTLALLINLAHQQQLPKKIKALFHGEKVNVSEARPALHTALRALDTTSIFVDKQDIMPLIVNTRASIKHISEKIRRHEWLGFTHQPITDIVNIGIGGSDLGPRFCLKALDAYTDKSLRYHFVSDADPYAFENTVSELNPEKTLFIVSSKSFTTQETLYNAKKAMSWLQQPHHHEKHFIAITAHEDRARAFGITQILPIWDWIGGRYSFCSAINLITAIAVGYEAFSSLLAGARCMDEHFYASPLANNLPVLLALFGIWNINFLNIGTHLILTYAQQLDYFVSYIQQLDMESNGKRVDINHNIVDYHTGPMVWGGLGNQAQHSYFQLLCQGTHAFACDFVSVDAFNHEMLNAFCKNKISVLSEGVSTPKPNDAIPGNVPLSAIHLQKISPYTIGLLVALYEHKIYSQSVIWQINAFDQPGVETAKRPQEKLIDKSLISF